MPESVLQRLEEFADILKRNEPLAPYTHLKVGGAAEALAQPRSREELAALVKACHAHNIPLRILGGGCNLLVRDEGVRGVVLRLCEPAFTQIAVDRRRLQVGGGASLASVISEAARHRLAGLETLVGIPGTIGGALCHNAGDRVAVIAQYVTQVEVVDGDGRFQFRQKDEIGLGDGARNLGGNAIVAAELELDTDDADDIVKRMRKAWIKRKSKQPLSYQASARAFRDPRGHSAADLLEAANLAGVKVGGAQLCERDANALLVHPGAAARDVLRLLDMARTQVLERFDVELEREITVW